MSGADIMAFFAPAPLSPLFQQGGALFGCNEDLTLICAFLALLFVVDFALVQPMLVPKARYFALHIVANTISTVAAFPDVVRAVTAPQTAFGGASHTMFANSAVCAIHLYHCLAFKLRFEDIMHHILFASILCGIAIPYKQRGGVANNFGCFFLSGLPGGIDYAMLVCVQQGWMDKMQEKKVNAMINTWLRGPAMSIYAFIGWQCWYQGNSTDLPNAALLLVVLLHFVNGQYYCAQAVGNYHVWCERTKNTKEGKSKSK